MSYSWLLSVLVGLMVGTVCFFCYLHFIHNPKRPPPPEEKNDYPGEDLLL